MGLVDIGTHMSFLRLESGKFLVVDCLDLLPSQKKEIDDLTANGTLIEAGTLLFLFVYFLFI